MKWCCPPFEGHFQEAGLRGTAVFAANTEGESPLFILQFRSTEGERPTSEVKGLLTLVSDTVINFCPWCGVRLSRCYRRTWKELDRSDLKIPLQS
jgi:hypothetical protein